MVRFDSDALFDPNNAPAASQSVRLKATKSLPALETSAPTPSPQNLTVKRAFPGWARMNGRAAAGRDSAFFAGASLALVDNILRADPPFANALRQRLALRAAAACASLARLREDAPALRDAEHLAPGGETMRTSPAGRLHRLWRLFATRPLRFDAASLRIAANLLGLPDDTNLQGLADALRHIAAGAEQPLAAAIGAHASAMRLLSEAPAVDAEIFALWLSDLALAKQLGWDAPVPLLATVIAHPSLRRGAAGKRPRPGDPDWADAMAAAYALAAQEAHALTGDLARRSEALLAVAPTLRAKAAGRVVDLLLADDCVAAARAARTSRLSDRAARRLFDRLIALGAVRELTGRPNFRLYGL